MSYESTITRDAKPRSGVALGGIGAGWFELRKDGVFHNWSIFNNYPSFNGPRFPFPADSVLFFVVRWQEEGREPRMKVLQVDDGYEVAAIQHHVYQYPWLTGVDRIDYEATFPFARLRFRDAEMPLRIEMEAMSPFIPHDVKHSSLPAAVFRFTVRSTAKRPVDVMILASMRNGAGYDVADKQYATHVVEQGKKGSGALRLKAPDPFAPATEGLLTLCELTVTGMDARHTSFGSQALACLGPEATYYAGWEHVHPYYEIVLQSRELPNLDDTAGRNCRDKETGKLRAMDRLFATVARSGRLARGQSLESTFLATWHFPNLYGRHADRLEMNPDRFEGHYYSNFFGRAAEVAEYVAANLGDLYARTAAFRDAFYASSLPAFVLDQVNSHLNTFHTSAWLTKAGDFGIGEGLTPKGEYGPLATIDVALYGSIMTAALCPDLDKAMLRAHARMQGPSGQVSHGINRNFAEAHPGEQGTDRLDLPSQFAVSALRAYFWTGDLAYLGEIWPAVRNALEYVLRERDPNRDLLPDMPGIACTYDNFPMHGAASYVAGLWLAALKAAAEAARALGDEEAAARYGEILAAAVEAFERKLWNGRYYRLWNDEGGPHGGRDEGCLTDQAIGQWAAHWTGQAPILDPKRVQGALDSILEMSFKEYGLLNCRWPGDRFLHPIEKGCWVDQANTCWSGVELAFASLLLCEGRYEDALAVIKNVDDRYCKAGLTWDHVEFGGHYFRPMSAWGIVNGALGLTIAGDAYGFAPCVPGKTVRLFFAFGGGTGHYVRKGGRGAETIEIRVLTGRFACSQLTLGTLGRAPKAAEVEAAGRALDPEAYDVVTGRATVSLELPEPLVVAAGQRIRVTIR